MSAFISQAGRPLTKSPKKLEGKQRLTNVLHAHGTETIWSLIDRRLSTAGRTVKDDTRKVMFLETPDGVATVGYAGLGENLYALVALEIRH